MQGFDINKLQREAHSRWLKPLEVHFILENHERLPITPQVPTMPPSGSLFLFNRRVLGNFWRDGHAWRKKKNGRTVSEEHEKLKVRNVDTLNCYYAHGEHNLYFQRRIYWMLDPAYEHIVFVHYREESEGRYSSGSISNLSGQSFSTFSQATSVKAQLETSGTAEFQEICQNSDSLGSQEEISSWSATEKFETYHSNTMDISGQPEVNHALQKIAEHLNLGDEAEDYLDEKLPPYPSQYDNSQNLEYSVYEGKIFSEKSHERLLHDSSLESCSDNNERQQVQSLGLGCTTESNPSPSWNHMLELSSNSPGITTHESVSNLPTGEDLLESSSCRTITLETQFPSRVFLQNEHAAGTVTDPIGKTPGEGNEISEVDAESAVESIYHRNVQMDVGGTEEELSPKDSLAAVRNASQAAALIQVAFRAHSFRKRREEAEGTWDEYGSTAEDILKLTAACSDQIFFKAALSIQKKYRGWKGRKDFLTLRQHVVKIQAVVRGHLMRKKNKKFLWSVSVLQKVA